MKASPDKFNDQTLAQAGVLSTAASKPADAVTFFAAAAKLNPYFRDYQYNLAAMMYESKQTAEMIPVVHKLDRARPEQSRRPDAVHLCVFGALEEHEGSGGDEGGHRFRDVLRQAGRGHAGRAWRTRVSSGRPTARCSWARWRIGRRTAQSYSIDFEFLGKDGAVLQKSTATVASVAPGATGNFKVDVPVGGVWGVR